MISARLSPFLFGLLLSGQMSLIVAGIATLRTIGLDPKFLTAWLSAWIASWMVAFPTVLFVAPLTRRLVARLTSRSS